MYARRRRNEDYRNEQAILGGSVDQVEVKVLLRQERCFHLQRYVNGKEKRAVNLIGGWGALTSIL